MKAYCITIRDNKISETGFTNLVESSGMVRNDFEINRFDAVTPKDVDMLMKTLEIEWNYPWDKKIYDPTLKLTKTPYATKNRKAKIACAISHYLLWKRSVEQNQPILILEHDALFLKQFDPAPLLGSKIYKIFGINSPINATRKAKEFDRIIQSDQRAIQQVPEIDEPHIPQGLAGGSAYLVKSNGAQRLVDAVDKYGLWPNDALVCYQLFGDILAVTKTYYTKVSNNLPSTTVGNNV